MTPFEEEVERTVSFLKAGKTILYPTDTIWGVGCDATNSKACDRVYAAKQRPKNKSLIVLVDTAERLKDYVVNVPIIAYDLIRGARSPLSIIYSEGKNLARNISSDKTVCIRVVENDFCKEIIRRLGRPITSTSANLSGQPTALTYNDISEEMKQSVDYTVQLYHDVMSKPKSSTIIRLQEDNTFEIVRN
ncbi:MAG: threonylcarbamoyl-AMP synthase [Bacteroidales bacterium]|jgi:L-threonylcarbamoyladenylate synthase|nr:threonylcarbamoyl-AMP synthase [Bacteroidales bacterium]